MTTTIIFALIFFGMVGYYAYFLVVKGHDVVNNSYNKRIDTYAESVIRGTIYSNDGKELAYTQVNDDGNEERVYPYDELFSHVVGIKNHGKSGLEKKYNYELLSTNVNPIQKIIDDFMKVKEQGNNIYTTLDVSLQETATESLGKNNGAVVIIDPDTGAILAMTSKPNYDPNTIDEIWDELAEDSTDSRLVNRATQGKYTPGSIFKITTTLEYMRENKDYNDFSYYCKGKATIGNSSIKCFDGKSHYTESLTDAFAYSCNSAFSTIGSELNMNSFSETAKDLLYNSSLPIEIEYNKSEFNLNENSTTFDIMQTSIGQGTTLVTPIHMALLASALANNGTLMKPYLVSKVEANDGTVVSTTDETEYKKIFTKSEAKQLKTYMRAVVEYGTGKIMANSDYEAYGKTGTAEIDTKNNVNSWFVGYAKKDGKKLAIAVVIEDMPEGSDSAVRCVKEIFDSYYK